MGIKFKRTLVIAEGLDRTVVKELCQANSKDDYSFLANKAGRRIDPDIKYLIYLKAVPKISLIDILQEVDIADTKYVEFDGGYAYANPTEAIIPPFGAKSNIVLSTPTSDKDGSNIGVFILCHSFYLPFLEGAMSSIDRQTKAPAEKVVILSGCDIPDMLKDRQGWEWIKGDWKNPNEARTVAFNALKSKWIVPLDADDLLEPEYIAQTQTAINKEAVKKQSLGIVYPDVKTVDVNLQPIGTSVAPWFDYWNLRKRNFISTSSAWRRDAVLNAGGWDLTDYFDDWALALKLTAQGWVGVGRNGAAVVARKHSRNRSKLVTTNKGTELVWRQKSFAVVTLFKDDSEDILSWREWLKTDEFPPNTNLYIIDATKSKECSREIRIKVLNQASLNWKFNKVSCITAEHFRDTPQNMCNVYNKILPTLTEDIVIFRQPNVQGNGVKSLVEPLSPLNNVAAVSAVIADKDGNDEIRGSAVNFKTVPIIGYRGFTDPLRTIASITDDFSVWDNYYLKKCLPVRTVGEGQAWYISASAVIGSMGGSTNLCGTVKCTFKDGILAPPYRSEFKEGDFCTDTTVISVQYGTDRRSKHILDQSIANWQKQVPRFNFLILNLLLDGDESTLKWVNDIPGFKLVEIQGTKHNRNVFQKECLWNLAASMCTESKHLIFADSDIIGEDVYWFDKIRTKLKEDPLNLVQGFRYFSDTGDGLVPLYSYGSQVSSGNFLAPGLIWGINRTFFDGMMHGWNQWAIPGSGDVMFIREFTDPALSSMANYLFKKHVWPNEILRHNTPKGKLTYVPVDIQHIFHGHLKNRAYVWSRVAVDMFRPITDHLEVDSQGLLAWKDPDCALARILARKSEMVTEEAMLEIVKQEKNIPDHFYKNIFGYFNYEKLFQQVIDEYDDSTPGHFVEIGCFLGKSTAFFATAIAQSGKNIRLDAVDRFKVFPENFVEYKHIAAFCGDSWEAFKHNTQPVAKYINPIKALSLDAAKLYEDGSLDFVYIDADHAYQNVKDDILAWLPKVARGGYLAGHDYEDQGVFEVKKAVDEIFGANFELVGNSWVVRI